MSFIAKTLRETRYKTITDAQSLINKPDAGDDAIQTFDAMMASADAQMEIITRVEKAASESAKIDEIIGASAERHKVSPGERANDVDRFKAGFVAMLRAGANLDLSPKDKTALEDYRGAASITGSAGGFTIPVELMRTIFAALVFEGGVRLGARNLQTAQGNNLDMPMNDDTAQVATLVAENTTLGTGTDLVFSKITLNAYKYTSGVQLISKELLQDSAFNFDEFVMQQLVHRFTRGTNLAYTVGTGSSQPQGVVTAATSGKVGIVGQTLTTIYADIVDLEHSLAVPYRRNAKWMMSDNQFKTIKKLVDTVGRPLWVPSLAVNAPDSLMGYDIILNADMATPSANSKPMLFADFSQFIIRDVLDLNFQTLVELYAATGQIGVVGLMRTDSRLASVGNCMKFYQNSAT